MAWTRYHGPVAPPLMPAAWTMLRAYQAGGRPGHRFGQVRPVLQRDRARYARYGPAADPHLAVAVTRDVHPAAAAEDGALAGYVRGTDPPGGDQPLRERGVQAARHRVLGRRAVALGEQRADLQCRRRPGRVEAGHADVQVTHVA